MAAISLPASLRRITPSSDVALALGVVAVIGVMLVPLPVVLLDLGLAISVTASVLVLVVALMLQRPLDFTSFPTILLLTTLLRLALNVATTRMVLTHGHEGPGSAGGVIAAFGNFLMGGDVLIGFVVFAILLIVNFMVVTKGSGRIAEVSARFSLDAMPGKQMAIDADLSSGTIDEGEARRRRRELEEESGFFGAMDGAAKFVRGDAVAGLIVTFVNLLGGLAIGIGRHGMGFSDAVEAFATLTVGDGLVTQIPSLLTSVAAGIVVTKGNSDGRADQIIAGQLGRGSKPLGVAAGAAGMMALMPGMPAFPFLVLAGIAGALAWTRHKVEAAETSAPSAPPPSEAAASSVDAPVAEALRMDMLRLDIGYGLLSLASGEAPQLTEQIRALRRSIAQEMGFVLPSVRVQDNMQLGPSTYVIRLKELEAARGELKPPMLLAIDAGTGLQDLPGERCNEPAFGLPALWIEESLREQVLARGGTVVDAAGVLATHLTEVVREHMAELLSYSETRRLLDGLPEDQRRLVGDLIPAQTSIGTVQRVLQALLAERVSIRDLPTILEGIQEATSGGGRGLHGIVAVVRSRLARQITNSLRGPRGDVPLVTLGPEWEAAFMEALVGPADDRQLAMAPGRVAEFVQRLRRALDTAAASGEAPALVCSGGIRPHVRAVVERFRPATPVLAQAEIFARAELRILGSV
ncbi:flagellar biosynthesis protein FlhA [Pararoseomonas baculiformis]|uniref:flagellar biosynthesis protein FlhA n=1 Tax=Pararoseomonas baculiformis TaxID=2820812 RepID=UPI0031591329